MLSFRFWLRIKLFRGAGRDRGGCNRLQKLVWVRGWEGRAAEREGGGRERERERERESERERERGREGESGRGR